MDYEFTSDWFSHAIPTWKRCFFENKPHRVLEVGSYEGRSACFTIEHCPTLQNLICVDLWDGPDTPPSVIEKRFDRNVGIARSRRANPVNFWKFKSASREALPYLIFHKEVFDFIYIDGSHEAPDVLSDAVDAFRLLRVGGLMAFDDYLWRDDPTSGHDILALPKLGIDAFSNAYHRKVVLQSFTPFYQVYFTKVSD